MRGSMRAFISGLRWGRPSLHPLNPRGEPPLYIILRLLYIPERSLKARECPLYIRSPPGYIEGGPGKVDGRPGKAPEPLPMAWRGRSYRENPFLYIEQALLYIEIRFRYIEQRLLDVQPRYIEQRRRSIETGTPEAAEWPVDVRKCLPGAFWRLRYIEARGFYIAGRFRDGAGTEQSLEQRLRSARRSLGTRRR